MWILVRCGKQTYHNQEACHMRELPTHEDGEEMRNLSSREREVVVLLSTGMTAREVAEKLHITTSTARVHTRNALEKTNSKNTVHLCVRWALGEI